MQPERNTNSKHKVGTEAEWKSQGQEKQIFLTGIQSPRTQIHKYNFSSRYFNDNEIKIVIQILTTLEQQRHQTENI